MGLKERLEGRKRPFATYWVLVDQEGAAVAEERLADARTRYQTLLIVSAGEDRVAEAAEQVARRLADVRACYEPIRLTAMMPDDFERLVGAHPPRPGTDDEVWDTKALPRECFFRCAPEEMTRTEWEEFLTGRVSEAERSALFNTAVAANVRVLDPTVPKDSTPTPS